MDQCKWIHAIKKGNKKYIYDIAETYYEDIYRFCTFHTGNCEDAYDLAQETYLRFIRYVENYREKNLKGCLLTIRCAALERGSDFVSWLLSGHTGVDFDGNGHLSSVQKILCISVRVARFPVRHHVWPD